MTTDALGAEQSAPFFPILNVPDTNAEIDASIIEAQVRETQKRGLPKLHNHPFYGKYQGKEPIGLVAGGPSLNETLDELRQIKRIMVCGSAHDYLVGLGFKPEFAVMCDPNHITAEFLKTPVHGCTYLIASGCHHTVFDALKGHNVVVWHSAGTDPQFFDGEPMIQGGCTVTLRALNLAIVLGFMDIHFFGLDSSFPDEERNHAYDYGDMEVSPRRIVQVGGVNGRKFLSTDGWLAQALHFQEQLRTTGFMFNCTVHGDGLIAEMMKCAHKQEKA